MKKLLIAFLLVAVMVEAAFAESAINPASDYTTMKTYVVVKDAENSTTGATINGSGFPKVKAVPTTTITTNSKIIGFTLTANTPDKGAVCSLHDVAAQSASDDRSVDDNAEQAMSNATIITEAEVGADPGSTTVWFSYPKYITGQLAVMIGQAHATVTIYYI